MPTLFISRQLSKESALRKWALNNSVEVIDNSLLRFEALPFQLPQTDFDWFFFQSPRGVDFFMADVEAMSLKHTKLAAIGKGTAKALEAHQLQPAFIGSGDPTKTAAAFEQVANGCNVLFVRAAQSRCSIERALGQSIQAENLIVYSNEIAPPAQTIPADILVFTSALNVHAWFKTHSKATVQQQFIAFGSSTAEALMEYGIQAPYPERPTEDALIRLLDKTL